MYYVKSQECTFLYNDAHAIKLEKEHART